MLAQFLHRGKYLLAGYKATERLQRLQQQLGGPRGYTFCARMPTRTQLGRTMHTPSPLLITKEGTLKLYKIHPALSEAP